MKEVAELSYINNKGILYLKWENRLYSVNTMKRSSEIIVENLTEGSYQVSGSNKMVAWQSEEGMAKEKELVLMDLVTGKKKTIRAGNRERIIPIGFMGEDLIYGIVREEDIRKDYAGNPIYPMYCVRIENEAEGVLMEYRQEGNYVTGGKVLDNQIILSRVQKEEDETFTEVTDDQIMNTKSASDSINSIEVAAVDIYEKLTQISLKSDIETATMKYLTPKEVLFEGGRNIYLVGSESSLEKYYVYGKYGMDSICVSAGNAVKQAEQISGVVVGEDGRYIWRRGNRSIKNQIMAIEGEQATEEKSALAVCLDTMLSYEGVVRNSEYMLQNGESVLSILEDSLDNARILDLTGCSLDAVLYYVDQDIPVLVMLEDGSAVLLVGFNEKNTVVMNPETGVVGKVGMNDSTQWFEENGNRFLTYVKIEE